MDDKAMAIAAAECQALARWLGDRQNRDTTLTGDQATRLVNVLLNAGNQLEFLTRKKEQPCLTPST